MNELERLAYLQAIGITHFVPRKVLPHAPASKACAWQPQQWAKELAHELALEWRLLDESDNPLQTPVTANNTAVEVSRQPTSPQIPPNTEPTLPSALSTKTNVETSTATDQTADAAKLTVSHKTPQTNSALASTSSSHHDTIPHFALSVWRVSEDWLIIDSRHSELALPTEAFLRNIVQAFSLTPASGSSLPVNQPLPPTQIFRWPMLKDPMQARRFGKGLNQGAEAAKEALSGFLDEQLVLQPARYLWLMGQDAIDYLLPASAKENMQTHSSPQGYLSKAENLTDWNIRVFCSPSLSELLMAPEKKAVLWQQWQRWHLRN